MARALLQSPFTSIIYMNQELFHKSLERFQAAEGPSFTDCSSFCVMDKMGLSSVFTHDSHFRAAGFKTVG